MNLELSFIVAFVVQAIWYSLSDGEIFERVGQWLAKVLPEKLHNPVFSCPICMTPWHGTIVLLLIGYLVPGISIPGFVLTLICAMGINVTIVKLWPHDE